MQTSRARFLSSDLTIVHGASAVSVWKNIASLASEHSSHLSSDARSMWERFQCFNGSPWREVKRRNCSSRVTVDLAVPMKYP